MKFRKEIVVLSLLAAIQLPCATYAAEEDRELSLIAAEQEKSGEDEQLGEINPALKDSLSTERTQETDKEIKERKKKLKQTRKEKEKVNERKLKESSDKKDRQRKEEAIVIEPSKNETPPPKVETPPPEPLPQPKVEPAPKPQPKVEPAPKPQPKVEPAPKPQPKVEPAPKPQPRVEPAPKPQPKVEPAPKPQPIAEPAPKPQPKVEPAPKPQPAINPAPPQTVETVALPNQKLVYANFAEVARAVHFIPLYMPRKSGYEITALYAGQGIAEIRYGRRWEPTVSLTVRTHKRADGEELQDISGVSGVKWRVDTTTGTTIYIAKISETQQVAAWAVGHYTFSAQAENLSYAGFHSLVADELVELSTHYYLDL
ncbi:MAG: hypothetical protein IJL12_08465 [Selenomonadaceae bacterium]|nr:hypothetical protein [Selenomonadaceae bacterium]